MQKISPKKQQLIDERLQSDFTVDERIVINGKLIGGYSEKAVTVTVKKVGKDTISVQKESYDDIKTINKVDVISRSVRTVGINPFPSKRDKARSVNYSLEGVLSVIDAFGNKKEHRNNNDIIMGGIKVMECNWNPYIYDANGKKKYYQRPFVWELKDKQNLVESIYNSIDCGKILLRLRSWEELEKLQKEGETELSFRDIVDGKQRLNAVISFINDEYADLNGNYFSDLSDVSQHRFTDHQLFSYSEMDEKTTDQEVVEQFLKLNFTGVPQSIEHINFVKSLL